MTGSHKEKAHEKIDAQLDAALEDSFPASDPVSIVTSQNEEYWHREEEAAGTKSGKDSSGDSAARPGHT